MKAWIARWSPRLGWYLVGALGVLVALWCVGALWFAPWPPLVGRVCGASYAVAVLAAVWGGRAERWGVAGLSLGILIAWPFLVRPQLDRDWSPDQRVLPETTIIDDRLIIRHVRDCRYRSADDYDVRLDDRTYDLAGLESVWFVVEPFTDRGLAAHTMLSFGFADGRYLAVSVEIRRERGEHFSVLAGLFRCYELMYVIGDENDLIGLRAVHRRDPVYLYPVRASRTQARQLLTDLLARSERLRTSPEFYHTLTNSCTTNLVGHLDRCWPGLIPPSPWVLLPGRSDRLAHELGLIACDQPFERCRDLHRIDERARAVGEGPEFSRAIRSR